MSEGFGDTGTDTDPCGKIARCVGGARSARCWVCLGLGLLRARISPLQLQLGCVGLSPIHPRSSWDLPAVPWPVAAMLCAAGGTRPPLPGICYAAKPNMLR